MAGIKFNCPHCQQPLEAPEDAAGLQVSCPSCSAPAQIPGPDRSAGLTPGAVVCAICQCPVGADEARTACPACAAEYHAECWQENGGCAVYGCTQVPVVEQRHAIEIPMSYWGREQKPCPACGREILAAAVRCRHCGATFASARPEDTDEFKQRMARQERLPEVQRKVIWLFVFCVLPCLAPIGAVWGVVWYRDHRDDVAALPSLYGALCKIGLGVALGETALVLLVTFLYAALRGP